MPFIVRNRAAQMIGEPTSGTKTASSSGGLIDQAGEVLGSDRDEPSWLGEFIEHGAGDQ